MTSPLKADEREILERFPPGADFHTNVRIGLLRKGETLSSWGQQYQIHTANVRLITHGIWSGKKGQALRLNLIKDAGLLEN